MKTLSIFHPVNLLGMLSLSLGFQIFNLLHTLNQWYDGFLPVVSGPLHILVPAFFLSVAALILVGLAPSFPKRSAARPAA